ncbi:MAG: branched-chain amino acid ABC transporter permease, partial [Alphaproteobacteria bacterium]|nr:branched-chain amino acid ABC transporter permease [Alphaproteobacteria bacterium]
RPCGDFRTGYGADNRIFDTAVSRWSVIAMAAALLAIAPFLSPYVLSLLIQIGCYGIAALGLNIVVGFSGQISLGHAAFFGFGAFTSAYLNNKMGVPVFFSIPLAGLITTAVGMVFALPAARIKGLYLAIATFAAQIILEDFFGRATWFTGGAGGAHLKPFRVFDFVANNDLKFFYVTFAWTALLYLYAANLMRSRDGRALVAVRDHYLSAEIMGIGLARYKVLAFGLSAFYAAVGGALMAHYIGFVSSENVSILLSIQFLGMIIIGGMGSIMGSLMGTAFMVLLPEVLEFVVAGAGRAMWGHIPAVAEGVNFLKEIAIGLTIVLFLIFEPDGLAHRWRMTKAYWQLYPFSH